MAKSTIDSKKTAERGKKPNSADALIKSGKTDKPELSEDDLKNVGGGSFSWGLADKQ